MSPNHSQGPVLAGRERQRAMLSGHLESALAGRGSLVLVGGEAGIGKTSLVRACSAEALTRGFLTLTGACYDTGTPPPYGPWRELALGTAGDRVRPLDLKLLAGAPRAEEFAAELRGYLEALVARGPLLVVLEDLHWADPESLEFLRQFARQIGDMPLLLVASYRDDDVTQNHALYQLVPQLVREANAERLHLAPLDATAIRTLIERSYDLEEAELTRLTEHIGRRSQGVPLYLLELLRAMEEEQSLRISETGWVLGDLGSGRVPVLIRQVIDKRLSRLPVEVRRLLEQAAVIGQDVPLLLWRRISGAGQVQFDEAVERAIEARVLEEDPQTGLRLRFTHAIVRDALYAGTLLSRRQAWHRRVAEEVESSADSELETVAYHYRQALDPRAAEWFIRAGSRVERVAWMTAARHFEAALEMLGAANAPPGQRGWLMLRRAVLLRVAEPRTALALLETAAALAVESGDDVLHAYVAFSRGQVRRMAGQERVGLAHLEASVVLFERLGPADVARVEELERQGTFLSRTDMNGHMAGVFASVGRVAEALAITQAIVEGAEAVPPRAWWGRAIALALAGRASEAREAYAFAREAAHQVSDLSSVVIMYLYQLSNVEFQYSADNLAQRSQLAREVEATWQRVGVAHGDTSPRLGWLPILQIEGEWQSARALALSRIRASDATSEGDLLANAVMAQLARAQGDSALAWELVHANFPGGPYSTPGDSDYRHGLTVMRIGAGLCLDREDLPAARSWLDAHDRWLAWSGSVLGQADGQIAWTEFALASGDMRNALEHATQALALASEPRQPLALLRARRLLGSIEAHAGRLIESRRHLEVALALADACAAMHERAVTLLAWTDLHLRAAELDAAVVALDEARAICERLGATPDLAHIEALHARLNSQATVASRSAPSGLSPRESEVLRMIASGKSNRDIADTLFLSERTIERHITNLYAKIRVQSRAEAIAFAHQHSLI